jgi:hypothetical protein
MGRLDGGLLAELVTEVLPQRGRHNAHRIQHSTAHAQKANLQRQPQLERRATPREWSIPGATQPSEQDRRRLVSADASVRSHDVAVD